MGDLGLPGPGGARDRSGVPGGHRRGARGRAEHHDVDEGRRQTGLVHRGLRGRSGRPRRLHRAAERGVRAPRHQGHLVRACLGRLPACAAGAEHEGSAPTCATMRAVAEECFALVREYKGSHSGEHGDGIVRSEFNAAMFGARIVRAFETVKDAFDPTGLLNPGRIVRPPRMDDRTLFRYGPGYAPVADFTPKLDWSDHPGAARRHARRGRDVQQQRRLPRLRCRRDVPVLPRHARRAAPDARPRQHAAAGADRAARRRRDGIGRAGRGDGAVRVVQGVPARMPDRRRHGEDEDRGAGGARRAARRRRARVADRGTAALCAVRCAHSPPLVESAQSPCRRCGGWRERWLGIAASRPLPAWRRDCVP